jgi:hypothetical protein
VDRGEILEEKASEVEQALNKVNATFEEFSAFYGQLIEKGIDETGYGKTFEKLIEEFKDSYVKAKSHYETIMLNKKQFNEGRLERDAYERSLLRISQYLIESEFEIGTKILPRLKKVEKQLLQEEIIQKAEVIDLPKDMKEEVKQDATEITTLMENAQKKGNIDQIKEYVDIGSKIIKLGEKLWAFAKKVAPVAIPLITLFKPL